MKGRSKSSIGQTSLFIFSVFAFAILSLIIPEAINRSTAAVIPPARKQKHEYKNWGLINQIGNSHIHAVDAWGIERGSRDVTVAVIDTGIDAYHPDLSRNIWKDSKTRKLSTFRPKTRVAIPKKVYGWDFVTNKPNPADIHGHGTHVAGIIGAVANPKKGVAGVAHNVSIMAVRYYSDANPGTVNLQNTIRAINYAIDNGAKVINYSGGGPEFSKAEYIALKRAEANGILVVAAAGNEHHNTDLEEHFYYPAAYGLSNIISVAATDIRNNLLPTSNWGKKSVHVAAPGENIFSTLPGGRYGYMTGTSQATAFVSGLAALLLSKKPDLTPQEIKKIIFSSVDPFPQLKHRIQTGGRVNAYKALVALVEQQKPKQRRMPVAHRQLKKPDLAQSQSRSLMDLFQR